FCASAAHGYGQVVVHSEAATAYPPSGIFVETPASIRELVNANFCTGINNHWMHVFLHQPWQRAEPGLTWSWGLQFQRNNTWFEKLGGWSAYVARSQYLLRQGLPVVDIVCFIGEAVPTAAGPSGSVKELNSLPAGIDYDVCNAEIILTRMSVKNGRIVLPDGMSYALLYVPPKVEAMRPEVLRKIRDLVRDGATVVGNRPTASPSLQNYPACDAEVKHLADEIWDGKIGRVYPANALKRAISDLGLVEDFSFTSANSDALIEYYHRRTADADIYFVANRRAVAVEAACTFRVDGRLPELWHPDTGRIEPAGAYEIKNGRTTLPLRFDPHDAMFVVFRKPASEQVMRGKDWLELKPVQEVTGPWQVRFDPKRGGSSEPVTFEKLQDWSKHDDPGIRYYSGAATYLCRFQIANRKPQIFLDLGEVREVAEVKVNGTNLGILWKTPSRVDITEAVRTGENALEIEVVNLWVNRMIGDERMYPDDIEWIPQAMGEWKGFGMKRLPDWFADWDAGRGKRPTGRIVFSTTKFFSAKDALVPSGLIGPVKLLSD
ncbi:MAG: glycosyl hydrolase, partial [Verrucomicrobiae bacterium]|nr:glycosyl hydrolase [Verrucomicrobiae bacterium]